MIDDGVTGFGAKLNRKKVKTMSKRKFRKSNRTRIEIEHNNKLITFNKRDALDYNEELLRILVEKCGSPCQQLTKDKGRTKIRLYG